MASSARRKKKSIPKSTTEMSQEALKEMLKKKKECNAKALSVVERLCEPSLPDVNWFLTNLAFINQSHFEDVVVERAILKLCGYPLCKSVLENVPTKKYYISTKLNKVFDITDRKNFCSNNCYKAGMYIKNQLLTSPLWFRDQEVIPQFKLLTCSSLSGAGDEVVFFPEREQLKKDLLTEETQEKDLEIVEEKMKNVHLKSDKDKDDVTKEETITQKSINNIIFYDKSDERKGSSVAEKSKIELAPVEKVEKCVFEWFTLETVLYLYGEDKVKEILKDKKEKVKEILGRKPLVPGFEERIDFMIKFYSMLDDEKYDCELVNKNLKPLPDYSAIKEDGKRLEVKVKAFYKGQLEINETDTSDKKDVKQGEGEEDENEVFLPVVDTHAQNTLRIKILLDRLNRVIPELVRTFTTASCLDISELKNLVSHFKLSAHNITFKPGEWDLIGFIIIKLLSLRNKQIECLLKCDKGKNHITLFLMHYGLSEDYLENIVEWLMNAEDLIKKLE